jgi:hypothetical protein
VLVHFARRKSKRLMKQENERVILSRHARVWRQKRELNETGSERRCSVG